MDLRDLLNIAAMFEGLSRQDRAQVLSKGFGLDVDEAYELLGNPAPACTLEEFVGAVRAKELIGPSL